ncbi:MAG: hypothetical protein H6625_03050 [Bdellovibrionaceae bacterium]|nr:hypothetical protein [Pseudobdellovibrionaceae bacterium]
MPTYINDKYLRQTRLLNQTERLGFENNNQPNIFKLLFNISDNIINNNKHPKDERLLFQYHRLVSGELETQTNIIRKPKPITSCDISLSQ